MSTELWYAEESDFDYERDHEEEAYNEHLMHTADGDAECRVTTCPMFKPLTVKCGNCKDKHSSARWVRVCYSERYQAEAEARAEEESDRAFARYLENRAESGSWFGYGR